MHFKEFLSFFVSKVFLDYGPCANKSLHKLVFANFEYFL